LNNIKELKYGSILSLLFLLILAISVYTAFGFITIFFVIIPFIIFGNLFELKKGIVMVLINILLAVILGGIVGYFIGLFAGSVGLTMGFLYKKGNALTAYVGGILMAIVNFIVLLAVVNGFYDINIAEYLQQLLAASIDSSQEILNLFGDQNQTEFIVNSYKSFYENIGEFLPLLFILYAVFTVSLNHFVVVRIMKKLGVNIPRFPAIKNWRFPKSIIFYYLIVVLIMMYDPLYEIYTLKLIAINLYPLLQIILILQGISFIFFYGEQKKWGKKIKVITIFALFIPILLQLIQMIGIIDMGFNLRKKLKRG